ncbi:MAG: hypothetical protein AAF628_01825 [Planctomycetota bacterium]
MIHYTTRPSHGAERGFALLAVLVALSLLLTLAVPFTLAMDHADAAAGRVLDQTRAELASASVRELILETVGQTHPSLDETSAVDDRYEFPAALEVPEGFAALKGKGGRRNLLAAEVEDLQRRVNLNTAPPLLLANLMGLVTRLTADHPPEASALQVADAGNFPESGWLLVDRELIRYGRREGGTFVDLERGMRSEDGYTPGEEHALPRGALVLDYRVVLIAAHSFYEQEDDDRSQLEPFASVDAVAGLAALGYGGFDPIELDALRRFCTVGSVREVAGDWGRAERLFEPVQVGPNPWEGRSLRVRNASDIPAGSIVRLRSTAGEHVEYGLAMEVVPAGGGGTYNLPGLGGGGWFIRLLRPPTRDLPELETVVEALLPHPVNVNTAEGEVLAALMANLGPSRRPRPNGAPAERAFAQEEARDLADGLRALRGDEDAPIPEEGSLADADVRPFDSFEDLAKRWFEPLLKSADQRGRGRYMLLYRALLGNGRGDLEMATAPISFTSSPVVAYRAAAARLRGTELAARHERTGTAVALPDMTLDLILASQAGFEEAFRIDRRAPFYQTLPVHVGSYMPFEPGSTPPSRHWAHVMPMVFPNLGFGQPRFPARDGAADGFRGAPARLELGYRNRDIPTAHESLWAAQHPEGRDLNEEGPYQMFNSGPRTLSSGGGGQQQQGPSTGSGAQQPTFPFTAPGGVVARQAVSFWFQLRDTGDQMLFDLSADQATRNRISLRLQGGELVLEVLDEAGLDPDSGAISSVRTSPDRTAGIWRLPLTEIELVPQTWYHVSLAADGNRPGQLTFLLDGQVPRDRSSVPIEPSLRTYLTQPIPEFTRPQSGQPFFRQQERYPEIVVESTNGFPDRGVLRIGLELFEYTNITGTSFLTDFVDSMGGRTSRMALREFRPEIEVDENGRPTQNMQQLTGGLNLDVAPGHPTGAAVELYGYVAPVYRDAVLQVGQGTLSSSIGAFAVARVLNTDSTIAIPVSPTSSANLGRGLDEDDTDNLELGNPGLDPQIRQPADNPIVEAFPVSGGYALLVQSATPRWQVTFGQQPGQYQFETGGIELIRYNARTGTQLVGIERGVTLPPVAGRQVPDIYDGQPRRFVTEWVPGVGPAEGTPEEAYQFAPRQMTYVVPISLDVSGSFINPTAIGQSEWVQLLAQGNDADTEWVRYDYLEGGRLVRAQMLAWLNLYNALSDPPVDSKQGGEPATPTTAPELESYDLVVNNGTGYIGYLDPIEVDVRFPQIHWARRALAFRGDPMQGFGDDPLNGLPSHATSPHPHGANTTVLQVHRFELDWGNYGARSGRLGRNDRVCLVAGSQASGTDRPPVEWHTVNWSARRYGSDRINTTGGTGGAIGERLGPYPFQLVAFKEQVADLFVGPPERNFDQDTRFLDRIVKFPSGELPAAAPEDAWFGSTPQRDVAASGGIVDELISVGRRARALMLDAPLDAGAQQFLVRTDLLVTPQGDVVVEADLTAAVPRSGGLLLIDGEVLAYSSHQNGQFQIATSGRGLLGTEPRGHDEGALVYYLDQVPAAILAANLNESSPDVIVQSLGDLGRDAGTLLVGSGSSATPELLHYTWTVGDQLLGMPEWADPEAPQTRGRGLFRGRYGSLPVSASAGEPVIFFPHRYWDRQHERADDPEMAYLQVTWDLAPVYFRSLWWDDDEPDPLIDQQCLVRIDGRGSFADDPETTPGLFLLEDGAPGELPNPLGWQGSRLEARFFARYRRGAFDANRFGQGAWKKAPTVRALEILYEAESRLLEERVSAR